MKKTMMTIAALGLLGALAAGPTQAAERHAKADGAARTATMQAGDNVEVSDQRRWRRGGGYYGRRYYGPRYVRPYYRPYYGYYRPYRPYRAYGYGYRRPFFPFF